jgi:integrase
MDTRILGPSIADFIKRLETDGFNRYSLNDYRRVLQRFQNYCTEQEVFEVTKEVIEKHLMERYGLSAHTSKMSSRQYLNRKALLSFWEFASTGTYGKQCAIRTPKAVPGQFTGFFDEYRWFVDSLGLADKTARDKLARMRLFLEYLSQRQLKCIGELEQSHVHNYLSDRRHAIRTSANDFYGLREAFEWMYGQGMIRFSGRDAFPAARAKVYSPVPSYYTDDEVRRILESVDISTVSGKRDFVIISLAAYLGLRCGDIAALRFDAIDWQNRRISITQQKTGAPLTLPLIDEVRYPLIDYIKNARPVSDDPHILLTVNAPITHYKNARSFHWAITKAMDKAGVDHRKRHHGAHSLRFSIAASLLKKNTPMPAISALLGHTLASSTSLYLGIDETKLAMLALEVPDVSARL